MSLISDLSHGWMSSRRGSGTLTEPTWLIGILLPYASTRTVSSSEDVALPERTEPNEERQAARNRIENRAEESQEDRGTIPERLAKDAS